MSIRLLILLVACTVLFGACGSTGNMQAATAWNGCSTYSTQPQAQQAWQQAGQPQSADRDRDGIVCESLPKTIRSRSCQNTTVPVSVLLDSAKYPQTAAHIVQAITNGQPSTLHLARKRARANRKASLKGYPVRSGFDRDEWPMAFTSEGGAGADIAYINPEDNSGAGSTIAGQLASYCDGTAFTVVIR